MSFTSFDAILTPNSKFNGINPNLNTNKKISRVHDIENLDMLGNKVYMANIQSKLKGYHNFHEFQLAFLQGLYNRKYKALFTIFYQICNESVKVLTFIEISSLKKRFEIHKMVMNSEDLTNIINLDSDAEILDKGLLIKRFTKFLKRISFYKNGLYRRPILEKTLSPKSKVWTIIRNEVSNLEKTCARSNELNRRKDCNKYMKSVVIERKLLGHFKKRVSLGINKIITTEMLQHMSISRSKMG